MELTQDELDGLAVMTSLPSMRADLVGVEKRWDTFERYHAMKLA